MKNRSYSTTITVDRSPDEVFAAINNVRGWWSGELEGDTTRLGDEFTYRYKDVHSSRQKITEMVPGKKVAWRVVDSHLDFVRNKTEWTGTAIVFDIAKAGDKTELRFTHEGLVPNFECFEGCSGAWGEIIAGGLRNLIVNGNA
jgi:hypothetical protein